MMLLVMKAHHSSGCCGSPHNKHVGLPLHFCLVFQKRLHDLHFIGDGRTIYPALTICGRIVHLNVRMSVGVGTRFRLVLNFIIRSNLETFFQVVVILVYFQRIIIIFHV